MLVPVILIQALPFMAKPLAADDVGPRRADVGLRPAVARWSLAARDVDLLAHVVDVGNADDAIRAGE